jgi:hypothetical protein
MGKTTKQAQAAQRNNQRQTNNEREQQTLRQTETNRNKKSNITNTNYRANNANNANKPRTKKRKLFSAFLTCAYLIFYNTKYISCVHVCLFSNINNIRTNINKSTKTKIK